MCAEGAHPLSHHMHTGDLVSQSPLDCPPYPEVSVLVPRWAQKQKSWRFQKTRQTWLLLNMYDEDKVCAQ